MMIHVCVDWGEKGGLALILMTIDANSFSSRKKWFYVGSNDREQERAYFSTAERFWDLDW